MPELPEVETTRAGLLPALQGAIIEEVIVRCSRLRWPIPEQLALIISKQRVLQLTRRAKYLLMHLDTGTVLIHLGMSGHLRLLAPNTVAQKHDHVDVIFNNQVMMRYTDPRRFGALLWCAGDPLAHPLLRHLGVEPLTDDFTGEYLLHRAANRKQAIKAFIMDSKIVVGVGNIYAAEALFLAGIHPKIPALALTQSQAFSLVIAIKHVLKAAIAKGGTTLKDFVNSEGKPGYFTQALQVYGRGGKPCVRCRTLLQSYKQGQRSTVFCPNCQLDSAVAS